MLSEPTIARLTQPGISRLVVGLSGGVDSIVLLHNIKNLNQPTPIVAVHINHGLQEASLGFQQLCESVCADWNTPLVVIPVAVKSSGSIEANARGARYDAWAAFLDSDDLLLLAHHADDQVETILFNLFRGSRKFGLQGMPQERAIGHANLYRPMLDITGIEIRNYAADHKLSWITDPTNDDVSMDRNYIRHEILPLIEQRWPQVRGKLHNALAQDDALRERFEAELSPSLASAQLAPDCLDMQKLIDIDDAKLIDLLTLWLLRLRLPQPSGKLLVELARDMVSQKVGLYLSHGIEFRGHEGGLYVLRALPAFADEKPAFSIGEIAVQGGRIVNTIAKRAGFRLNDDCEFAYRQGGEKIHITHRRTLKQLFQESKIPVWLRARIPLIVCRGEIVAVAALPDWGVPMLIADGWLAPAGEKGVEISLYLDDRLGQQG